MKVNLELNEKGKAAFEMLKGFLQSSTVEKPEGGVLMIPNFAKEFVLYTDACDEGLWAFIVPRRCREKDSPSSILFEKTKSQRIYYLIERTDGDRIRDGTLQSVFVWEGVWGSNRSPTSKG